MSSIYNLLRKIYHRLFRRDPMQDFIKRGLIVGKRFQASKDVNIDYSHAWHIEIGDDVTFAARVHVLAHDTSTKIHLNYTRIGRTKIGNRVFVGANSIILPGVTIGNDVIIGAGSIVSRDVQDRQVVAGNPARVICTLGDFLKRKREEMALYPCFGEDFTIEKNVTDKKKNEMNARMTEKIGYIV